MKTLTNSEYKLLEKIITLTQDSLFNSLVSLLRKEGYSKITYDNKYYMCAEGDIPIALVAHLDTVFQTQPDTIYYDRSKNVVLNPEGLGADDRAGVFAILKIIKTGLRPHIIFLKDEEIGGKGAIALSKQPCPFAALKYLIELDRHGSNDCVFYHCENPKFTEYVESFGFEWNYGTYSDIYDICPEWKIAGVNLSIGYENEHSYQELLHVGQMLSTINKVIRMLNDAANIKEPFKFIRTTVLDDMKFYSSFFSHDIEKCSCCGRYFMVTELFQITDTDLLNNKLYCSDCIDNKIEWCNNCGNPYEKAEKKCPICNKENENKESVIISN